MRSGDHVRQAHEGRILRRLFGENVHGCAGQVAALERAGEGGFLHQFAARRIDQPRAALHLRECGRVDHVLSRRAQCGVERDKIALGEQALERRQFNFRFARGGFADVRIESQHAHLKRARAPRHFAADAAETDQPERFAAQLGACGGRLFPAAGANRGVEARHLPRQGQKQSEGMLRHAHCVAAGSAHHQHASARGRVQVNIIHADAGAADDAEP